MAAEKLLLFGGGVISTAINFSTVDRISKTL